MSRNSVGLAAAILAAWHPATWAVAEINSIHVAFDLNLATLEAVMRKPETVESDVAIQIARGCEEQMPGMWRFRPTTDLSLRPLLEIEVVRTGAHQADGGVGYAMNVQLRIAGAEVEHAWACVALLSSSEVEMEGIPLENEWPALVRRVLAEKLHNNHTLREKLMPLVPFGTVVQLQPSTLPPHAVLPLDWEKHWQLALSTFRIEYRSPERLSATVSANAAGQPCRFDGPPTCNGILVRYVLLCRLSEKIDLCTKEVDLTRHVCQEYYLSAYRLIRDRAQLDYLVPP